MSYVTPTRIFLTLAFVIAAFSAKAQQVFFGNKPRPTYGGFNATSMPIYRSPKDSVTLLYTEAMLTTLYEQKPVNQKKIDSIQVIRSEIFQNGITGFRSVYYPSPEYTPFDSLAYIQDKSTVTRLSIISRKLSHLPDEVLQCTHLEVLEFVNCDLRKLPKELNRLTQLRKVQVMNNRSPRKLKLAKNHTVKNIAFRGDGPAALPRSFKNFDSLTKIDLSDNSVTRFTNAARHNKRLVELDLQRNKITLKENNIKRHRYVQRIGLQYNAIPYVPSSVKHFENARKIGFNHNKIKTVHPDISQLSKLEHLSFYNNKLEEVPEGVYNIRSLKVIDLFHNQIFEITDKITNWQQLNTLYLSHNYLSYIPSVIDQLPELDEIYAYDNFLKELPPTLCNISALKVLRVNINKISQLPLCIDRLQNMEEMDVSGNAITDLPASIFSFPHLKILAIVNNPWNDSLRSGLPAMVKKLRDNKVSVHLDTYGEEEQEP